MIELFDECFDLFEEVVKKVSDHWVVGHQNFTISFFTSDNGKSFIKIWCNDELTDKEIKFLESSFRGFKYGGHDGTHYIFEWIKQGIIV